MESSLEASARARAAVDAFLKGGSSSEDEDVNNTHKEEVSSGEEADEVRPNRLGLGATPTAAAIRSAAHGATERAQKRLERGIWSQNERARRMDEDGNEESSEDSEDEMMSRTKMVGTKKRKRPKKKKQKTEKRKPDKSVSMEDAPVVEEDTGTTAAVESVPERINFANPKYANNQNRNDVGANDTDNGANKPGRFGGEGGVGDTRNMNSYNNNYNSRRYGNGGGGDEGGQHARKRKKTRSRQKNLRRDKRPKHMLPAHLTEESLLEGRLPRHDAPQPPAGDAGQ